MLISAPSPESEPVLIERGRREAHRCDQRTTVVLALQSCGWQARGAGAGLRRAREASGAVERWLEHRCPRNNTWHRPKLSTGVRDRSVRTQCTSLSHGGARAPEEMWVQLSEDKTASTIPLCVKFNHLIGRCCTEQPCPKSPWVYAYIISGARAPP